MSKKLFDNDSESEGEELQITTNKDYAKSYNKFRQKELLKKLKDKDLHSSSGSESSSESDYSEEEIVNNPKFDEEFLKILSSIKQKDPKIYDKQTTFFENVDIDSNINKANDNKKPFTLKEYERKVILEKGGKYEDDGDDDDDNVSIGNAEPLRSQSPTYAEEQERLKQEFKQAINSDDSDNEEFGGILKKREKTKEQEEQEESEYLAWLAGKKEDVNEKTKEILKPLKQYWNKDDLPKEEKFLRDYILNNGYIDKENDEIPTYDEIVGNENLSEDENELEKQAEFEHNYNFRYEEPDKDFIKRYPRTIDNSVRKQDDKRKRKRDEVKERKLKEKEEKYKEIEMLKSLKMKEIEEKIQKLKEVTGNEELAFKEDDFDEDFDPEAHDKRMREIFNEDYYEIDEGEEKPDCPDIEELKIEDWDNFDPTKDNENDECYNYDEPHCEDDDFNMDCDYDPNDVSKKGLQNELIENSKDKRKRRKRRNHFMEMIKTEKPAFNPEDEKTYAEYIDEYYKMDCEDIIGDIPCRFKYVETTPNDFGLTIEEILLAKTKELNQWASLKKATQIRPEQDEKRDVKLYQQKARNEALKRKIFVSLYGEPSNNNEDDEEEKIEKSKNLNVENASSSANKKKKRKKQKANKSISDENPVKLDKANKDIKEKDKTDKEIKEKDKTDKEIKQKDKPDKEIKQKDSSTTENPFKKQKKAPDNFVNKNVESNNVKIKNGDVKNKIKKSNEIKMNKKFKKQKNPQNNSNLKINDERLKAYGLNPRKFHKAQKYMKLMKYKNQAKNKMNKK